MDELELLERLKGVEERAKSNSHRLDMIEEQNDVLHRLVTSVELLTQGQKYLKDNMDGIRADLESVKGKPAKRWDDFTSKLIGALLAGLVGFLLAQIGLG